MDEMPAQASRIRGMTTLSKRPPSRSSTTVLNMKQTILAALAAIASGTPLWAQDDDSLAGPELGQPGYYETMREAAWDWRPGDLIFRNGMKRRDELVRDAEGGRWATVGLLRAASGDPRVVYVDESLGVTEVMLDEFIHGLSGSEYAVYRIGRLDANSVPGRQMEQGPLMRYVLFIAYEHRYDPLMLLGRGGFYNADLPYIAALSSGVFLGDPVPLETLGDNNPALRADLLVNWQSHPQCRVQFTSEDCWEMIKGTAVVTPRVLIDSPEVQQVFPPLE